MECTANVADRMSLHPQHLRSPAHPHCPNEYIHLGSIVTSHQEPGNDGRETTHP